MADFPEIYVLRHGETVWNAQGRLQGAEDSTLTPLGRQQAARQGAILNDVDLSGFDLFRSPQGRAFETAAIALAPHIANLKIKNDLREIGIGEWAGRYRDDLGLAADALSGPLGGFALYELAPGGEGLAALEVRCFQFLQGLRRPAVLVTHGITSRMLRAVATGQGRNAITNIGGGQGVIYRVTKGVQKRFE